MTTEFVSACCQGERCSCGKPASHKVEETVFHDDPAPARHPRTAYICSEHFAQLMGQAGLPPVGPVDPELQRAIELYHRAKANGGLVL